jgi:hypothetical protein
MGPPLTGSREIAIEEMLRTVEEAMSQVIDWWETCRCR